MRIVAIFVAALIAAHAAVAAPICEQRSAGRCFSVHGVLAQTNGTPGVRIRQSGTGRVFGVVGGEDARDLVPPALAHRLGADARMWADWRLCPLSPARPGGMRMVCIAGARNAAP